jgi:hypothetical protein
MFRLESLVRLYIHRHNFSGVQMDSKLAVAVRKFQKRRAYLDVPCWDSQCGGTRERHRPGVHESISGERWYGAYQPAFKLEPLIAALATNDRAVLTVLDLPDPASTCDYFPTGNCCGCLFLPIAITLSCGHPFCNPCTREMTRLDQTLHLLPTIHCLFCSHHRTFSPRFLPDSAGYRILVLDAARGGIALVKVLQSLERVLFIIYLFIYLFLASPLDTFSIFSLAQTLKPC